MTSCQNVTDVDFEGKIKQVQLWTGDPTVS